MANPSDETVRQPFTSFNFAVEIRLPGQPDPLCSAAFAECDGVEITFEVKTIREGGNNARQIRLNGPANFGTLTLKRGMTRNLDLWDWATSYARTATMRRRAEVKVVVFAADGTTELVHYDIGRVLPIKIKAPALNAKDGVVAIEELQLQYETLDISRPEGN
jgi:phage tail-like protein